MGFLRPKKLELTVYSKSGCSNCIKVKQLLAEKSIKFSVIDCDEYLLEDRDIFLQFIRELSSNRECKTFPMVFDNNVYIGGFIETNTYVNKLLNFELSF